jgi:hypothetical protein
MSTERDKLTLVVKPEFRNTIKVGQKSSIGFLRVYTEYEHKIKVSSSLKIDHKHVQDRSK